MKILWGFVPFQQDSSAIKCLYKQIRQLVSKPEEIQIGYVLTGNESYINTTFSIPLQDRFSICPKKLILENLKKARISFSLNQIPIVQHRTLSTTKTVDRFLELAKLQKVEHLALFTQGKTGASRLFLGSFSETAGGSVARQIIRNGTYPVLILKRRNALSES